MKNPDSIKAFGLHLRKLRDKHGLSQQDVADRADVNKKTIQRIETGKLNPSLDTLVSLTTAFEITLRELLDFEH